MSDAVNHPAHYGGEDNPYETIKVLKAKLTPERFRGFCVGNAYKYIDREQMKGGDQDLRKAAWYCLTAAGDDPRKIMIPLDPEPDWDVDEQ